MISLRYIATWAKIMITPTMITLIIIAGVLGATTISTAPFFYKHYADKGKRETALEIAKHMNDSSKVEELLAIFEEKKGEPTRPIDYRRAGVMTLSVGIGLFLFGFVALGFIFEGIGLLVGTIGIGTLIAGYLYPNTSEELTNAVEEFEKK